jgi:phage terminase Nu1 subunit (DNA packaging protein)
MAHNFDAPCTQAQFADLIGVSRPMVTTWVKEGKLVEDASLKDWVRSYCARIREVAAGRGGPRQAEPLPEGQLDLTQERAALARTQRLVQEVKLAIAKGEYGPIGLLGDTLAGASSAVVAQFDQLEASLAKTCPDLDPAAKVTVLKTIAQARNQWISHTTELLSGTIDMLTEPDDPA